MTLSETAKILNTIDELYLSALRGYDDNKKLSVAKTWHRLLVNHNYGLMQKALELYANENKRFPNIADLLEAYREVIRIESEPKYEWYDYHEVDTGLVIKMRRVIK